MAADIEFFWDPICPFAWVTSRWVQDVADQRDYEIEWRFICLRLLNEERDYDTEFPPDYIRFHTTGQQLLRVAASAREAHGADAMGPLYTEFGRRIWDRTDRADIGEIDPAGALVSVGLDPAHAKVIDDASYDAILREEPAEALSRTGDDVGTPIITYGPPDGPSFFGPVIGSAPTDPAESLRLWDAVTTLVSYPSFAEIKRSLRELPDVPLLRGRSAS